MPLSRMENTTFAMASIIDSHDMGLKTVLQSGCPKQNAYSTQLLDRLLLLQWQVAMNFGFSGTTTSRVYSEHRDTVKHRIYDISVAGKRSWKNGTSNY
ncbi:hypothetical protein TNCV_549801 [Trichonephila clavipes]|nr:hypothetical protein TNCV_549801 [Trichonephila clavipes]